MAIEKKLTEAHLERLFSQQRGALKKKSVVVELSEYAAEGLSLILCLEGVGATFAATQRTRDGKKGAALDGRFAFEYDGDQFLDGVEFDPRIINQDLGETMATFGRFATQHGFRHVRALSKWKGDGTIFHVWMGAELGVDEKAMTFAAVEKDWAKILGRVLTEWSSENGEPVRNVILYWGGEDHTGLEALYINDPALDGPDASDAGKLRNHLFATRGSELLLEDDDRPSFEDLPKPFKDEREAFLAHLCATLETGVFFRTKKARGPSLRVFSKVHDDEPMPLALLEKARAEVNKSADAFVAAIKGR